MNELYVYDREVVERETKMWRERVRVCESVHVYVFFIEGGEVGCMMKEYVRCMMCGWVSECVCAGVCEGVRVRVYVCESIVKVNENIYNDTYEDHLHLSSTQ